MDKVDLVVPYVDSSDKVWQEQFKKYNPNTDLEAVDAINRFRGQGEFFRYFFRTISKNLPWLNNIFLIVQSDSQVPKWINRDKVKIVYHEDFIPQEYLPTFNSTTIEVFVPFINGLSNKFIYANDDMFLLKPMKYSDFYDEDSNVRINTTAMFINNKDLNKDLYVSHLINTFCLARNKDINEFIKQNTIVPTLGHKIRPYLKNVCIEGYNLHKDKLLQGISQFRTKENHNMYFYDHYQIYTGHQVPNQVYCTKIISGYTTSKELIKLLYLLADSKYNLLCIQDTDINPDSPSIYENHLIINFFNKYYAIKSKYEL